MGRIETSGGNLGVQEAWFGFLMCAAPEVWQCVTWTRSVCTRLETQASNFVTRPLIGPPEDAETVDVLSRSFIHPANVYSALRTRLVLYAASEAGRAPNCTELAGHQHRACSQHHGWHIVGPS